MSATWNQSPDSLDPSLPILVPPTPERQRELDAMSWIGYLNSLEWKQIRRFMLAAYPASQVSGETANLECHHVRWVERGHERPRDLCILTADEHRRVHGSIPRDELVSLLLIEEADPEWVPLLQSYRRAVAASIPMRS